MKKTTVTITRQRFIYTNLGRAVPYTQRKRVSIYYNTKQDKEIEINRKTELYKRGLL